MMWCFSVGGIIPKEDDQALHEMGVLGIFSARNQGSMR